MGLAFYSEPKFHLACEGHDIRRHKPHVTRRRRIVQEGQLLPRAGEKAIRRRLRVQLDGVPVVPASAQTKTKVEIPTKQTRGREFESTAVWVSVSPSPHNYSRPCSVKIVSTLRTKTVPGRDSSHPQSDRKIAPWRIIGTVGKRLPQGLPFPLPLLGRWCRKRATEGAFCAKTLYRCAGPTSGRNSW